MGSKYHSLHFFTMNIYFIFPKCHFFFFFLFLFFLFCSCFFFFCSMPIFFSKCHIKFGIEKCHPASLTSKLVEVKKIFLSKLMWAPSTELKYPQIFRFWPRPIDSIWSCLGEKYFMQTRSEGVFNCLLFSFLFYDTNFRKRLKIEKNA